MLADQGYAVVPGPFDQVDLGRVIQAYERATAEADPEEIGNGSTSVRINGIVGRAPMLGAIFGHAPLLRAASAIIGESFKLSAFHARSVRPGAVAQSLHQDVAPRADGWPLIGFIFMVDAFRIENGATRFVSGSQLSSTIPAEVLGEHPEQRFACGAAGSMILFHGSVWHGHGANRTTDWRRSIQGALIPASARAAVDHRRDIPPEILSTLSPIQRGLLAS